VTVATIPISVDGTNGRKGRWRKKQEMVE